MKNRILLLCLVFSGYCGLAYELLWVRLLSFSFGSTTLSFSTVLAVFFGGLAIGSWLTSRFLSRIGNPGFAYGIIEIATGIFGLILYPILKTLPILFGEIDPGSGIAGVLVRFAFSAPLLLVPTVLMGATLPIICKAMIKQNRNIGRGTGLVYGFNTFGAFLGSYLVTYHFLPALGIFQSILVTVGLNFLAGSSALVVSWRTQSGDAESQQPAASQRTSPPADRVADDEPVVPRTVFQITLVLTFISGFAFICFEIVWSRLFSIFLGGTVYGVGAVLICFLIGIAVGSLLVSRLAESADSGFWFLILQAISVLGIFLLSFAMVRVNYTLAVIEAEPFSPITRQHIALAVVFISLLIPTACSGASFPLLVRIITAQAKHTGRSLGSLYASNTCGSILGCLVTGFVLIPKTGSEATIFLGLTLIALMTILAGLLLRTFLQRLLGPAIAFSIVVLLTQFQGIDLKLLSCPVINAGASSYRAFLETKKKGADQIIAFAEGETANVAVFHSRTKGTKGLFLNGLGQGMLSQYPPTHSLESSLVAVIPMAFNPSPQSALVVGLGAGITVDLFNKLGVPRTKVIELEEKVVPAVDAIFSGDSPIQDPRIDLEIDDARHYLLLNANTSDNRFDLITSMPSHPWIANSIFTQEFFELARDNLSPNGIFSTWFGVQKFDGIGVESLIRAFTNVFSHYVIFRVPEVEAYYLVGANEHLQIDTQAIEDIAELPELKAHEMLENPMNLLARIYATGDETTPKPTPGITNTDDSAFIEVHYPRAGTSSPIIEHFLAREYLAPSFAKIHPEEQKQFYGQLLEVMLGTPGGDFNFDSHRPMPDNAERTLEGVGRSLFVEKERLYFQGRIFLAKGERQKARSYLLQASHLSGAEINVKAVKYYAMTFDQDEPQRLNILKQLPLAEDILMLIAEIDKDVALIMTPKTDYHVETQPFAWFLKKFVETKNNRLNPEDRKAFAEYIVPELIRIRLLSMFDLGIEFSKTHDFPLIKACLEQKRSTIIVQKAESEFQAGLVAGRHADFEKATVHLKKAIRLRPSHFQTALLLFQSLAERGRFDEVDQFTTELQPILGKEKLDAARRDVFLRVKEGTSAHDFEQEADE